MRGIIYVHGIGAPEEGAHLRKLVRSWTRLAADDQLDVRTLSSVLSRDGDTPPNAEVEVAGEAFLVVEASWKHLIPEPTFAEVALWLLVVAPFTMIDLLRSVPRRYREALTRSKRSALVFALEALFRLVLGAVLFPLWFVPLILAMAASSLIPGNLGQAAVARLQTFVSGVLGDSYLFVDDPAVRASVVDQVRSDIAWLLERCDLVQVIGHSQGAHVALSATTALTLEQRARVALQTWGSGFRRLRQLEAVMGDQPVSAAQAFGAVFGLPVIAVMIAWADGAWTLVGYGVVALSLLLWWIVAVGERYELTEQDVRAVADRAPDEWRDLWATRDIVSDGALPGGVVVSEPVINRASLAGDHSTYHQNPLIMTPVLRWLCPSAVIKPLAITAATQQRWWSANHLFNTIAVGCLALQYVRQGITGFVAAAIVAVPLMVWSRFELHWRLRRVTQLRNFRKGPFSRWLETSHNERAYPLLTVGMGISVLLAAFVGADPPATIDEGTSIGVTAGFGNGRALLGTVGSVVCGLVVYTALSWSADAWMRRSSKAVSE